MRASSGKGIQVQRRCGRERFPLTGFLLRNFPVMKGNGSHKLHVKVTLSYCAMGGFPHQCKSVGKNIIKRSAMGQTLFEFRRLSGKSLPAGRLAALFDLTHLAVFFINLCDNAAQPRNLFFVAVEDLTEEFEHGLNFTTNKPNAPRRIGYGRDQNPARPEMFF